MVIVRVLIAIVVLEVIAFVRTVFYKKVFGLTTSSESDFRFELINTILLAAWIISESLK